MRNSQRNRVLRKIVPFLASLLIFLLPYSAAIAQESSPIREDAPDRYVVKEGDNLSSIAQQFNIPLPAIIFWNRLDPNKPIHPGDKLIIQR